MTTSELLASSPAAPADRLDLFARCIDACAAGAQACLVCADACLAEPTTGELIGCIRLDLDCADICTTTGRLLARQHALDPALAQAMLQTCVAACRLCADECGSHASHHDHCARCADACRACEEACRALLGALV
jgi:hypothetical protein